MFRLVVSDFIGINRCMMIVKYPSKVENVLVCVGL